MLIASESYTLGLEPIVGLRRAQRVNAVDPGDLALDVELPSRQHRFGIIETVDRDADVPGADERVRQRRTAIAAEAALDHVGALEDRQRAARPAQVLSLTAGQAHEGLAGRLLAHPAITDARMRRFLQPLVTQRSTLAAAGQSIA